MKRNLITYTAFCMLFFLLAVSCKKIQPGFLSETMRYKDNVIYAKRGMTLSASDRINLDGSTPPITFELLNLRDKATGEPAPEAFFTDYDLLVFKEGVTFNAETDTTIALLDAKREEVRTKPMIFNTVSGQLIFNRASVNLPLGVYEFDLNATNVNGTRFYPAFAEIHVVEPDLEDVFELEYQAASVSDAREEFENIKAPRVTSTKISNEGARVILKITDKNGTPFNPAAGEIIRRGDRPTFETHARFNPVLETDTALICDFEVAPFPLTKYITPDTDWNHLIYYRIPKEFISVDGQPSKAANPVFGFQIKMEGTYVVEVQLTDAVRIAGGPARP